MFFGPNFGFSCASKPIKGFEDADYSLVCKNILSQKNGFLVGVIATSGVVLNARFTTNRMCVKNSTHIYEAQTSNNRVIVAWKLC